MGLYLFIIVLIYVFVFRSAAKKRNKSGKMPSSPKTPTPSPDYSGTRPNPFRRQHVGAEACEDDHAYCSHISVDGKFKDFENRENDWLARQMAEERRIANKLDFLK